MVEEGGLRLHPETVRVLQGGGRSGGPPAVLWVVVALVLAVALVALAA